MINFPDSPVIGTAFSLGQNSWAFDGVKWLAAGSSVVAANETVNTVAPTSGTTLVLSDFRPVFVSNPTTLAALTIQLPLPLNSGAFVEITFRSPVTALTMQDAAGTAVPAGPTSAYGPGAGLQFIHNGTFWVYWK
jgi:hypothetical protein